MKRISNFKSIYHRTRILSTPPVSDRDKMTKKSSEMEWDPKSDGNVFSLPPDLQAGRAFSSAVVDVTLDLADIDGGADRTIRMLDHQRGDLTDIAGHFRNGAGSFLILIRHQYGVFFAIRQLPQVEVVTSVNLSVPAA